jgi:hypothetical protein
MPLEIFQRIMMTERRRDVDDAQVIENEEHAHLDGVLGQDGGKMEGKPISTA